MSWLLAFVGFALLVLLHEFGHFVAAKAVGMRVERFSLGLGPLLVGVKRGETTYGIAPIPLGGYVKITGMNPYELEGGGPPRRGAMAALEGGPDPATATVAATDPAILARAYYRQPVWKRIVVIAAGPAVNIFIAFLIFGGLFLAQGYDTGQPSASVNSIVRGAPAASVLRPGDQIVSVDGVTCAKQTTACLAKFSAQIATHTCAVTPPVAGCRAKTPVRLVVRRGSGTLAVSAFPRYDTTVKPPRPRLGFAFGDRVLPQNAAQAAGNSVKEIGHVTSITVTKIVGVFFSSKDRKQVNSVVGGYEYTRQAFSFGVSAALSILGLISLSLGIINLFPFLPLDGGHIFWAVGEKLRGRAIPFAVMERASAVGIALVLFLFLIGFTNDVNTLTNGGFHLGSGH
jgi:regulator of sigma E protease